MGTKTRPCYNQNCVMTSSVIKGTEVYQEVTQNILNFLYYCISIKSYQYGVDGKIIFVNNHYHVKILKLSFMSFMQISRSLFSYFPCTSYLFIATCVSSQV